MVKKGYMAMAKTVVGRLATERPLEEVAGFAQNDRRR